MCSERVSLKNMFELLIWDSGESEDERKKNERWNSNSDSGGRKEK